jgi:hypothetical protein
MRKNKAITSLGLLAAVAVTAAIVLGAVAQGDEQPAPDGQGDYTDIALDPKLAAKFSALAEPKGPDDRLPNSVNASGRQGPNLVLNPDLARHGGTYASGGASYLVPGDNGLCIVLTLSADAAGGGMACNETSQIEAGFLGPASLYGGCEAASSDKAPPTCGTETIYGIAPDGVARVELRMGDGSVRRADTVKNTYALVLTDGAQARSLSWQGSDGKTLRSFRLGG